MLVIKYKKTAEASFISHIDLLKHMGRIIRRADIPMNFSQGFNPHPLLFFSPPMVLGAQSSCEYVFISTELDSKEAFEKFSMVLPKGLIATTYFNIDKNPNLQAKIQVADYVFPVDYKDIDFSSFIIKYKKKGEEIEEDVSSKIIGAYNLDGKLCLKVAAGNSPLRPDRIINKLEEIYNQSISLLDIVKVKQYVLEDGKYIDVDDYLKK